LEFARAKFRQEKKSQACISKMGPRSSFFFEKGRWGGGEIKSKKKEWDPQILKKRNENSHL
jgi:hypothetical protein